MVRSFSTLRNFTVGETVHLRSRISVPGTRTPIDPALVALTSLKRDGVEVLTSPSAFTKERTGEYSLVIQTSSLQPGTYQVVVTHSDGPERVTISTDEFVLANL